MKYSLPKNYYRLLAEHISHHEIIFWDEDRQVFVDEGGFEIYNIHECVPAWAMTLAMLNRGPGTDNYFCFTPNSWTMIEIFWPDEEREENWYT